MKLRVPFALAVVGTFTLACSGLMQKDEEGAETTDQPTTTEEAEQAPALVEPWSAMDLPIEDGEIVRSSAEELELRYAGRTWTDVGDAWVDALTRAGWSKTDDSSTATARTVHLEMDGQAIDLEARASGDDAIVTLTEGEVAAEVQDDRPVVRGKSKIRRGRPGASPRAGVHRAGGGRAGTQGSGAHTPGTKSSSSGSHTPGSKGGTKSSSSGSHTPSGK